MTNMRYGHGVSLTPAFAKYMTAHGEMAFPLILTNVRVQRLINLQNCVMSKLRLFKGLKIYMRAQHLDIDPSGDSGLQGSLLRKTP